MQYNADLSRYYDGIGKAFMDLGKYVFFAGEQGVFVIYWQITCIHTVSYIKNISSKYLIDIGSKTSRIVCTKSIVQTGIGAGILVEFYSQTFAATGLYGSEIFAAILRERLQIAKDHSTQQAVSQNIKSQFSFKIQHVPASESARSIASAGIVV